MIVREANADDSGQIARLVAELGHHLSADDVRSNLACLAADGLPQFVAAVDEQVAGLLGMDRMQPVYRLQPVGRITILIVAKERRGCGIGRALVDRAIAIARDWGCGMLEVTSNHRLEQAHAYYRHLGFEDSSRRFALQLG